MIILVILIAREFVPFQVNIYKSYNSYSTSENTDFTNTGLGTSAEMLTDENLLNLDIDPTYHMNIEGIDNGTFFKDGTKNLLTISANQEKKISAFRFIPLIKYIPYSIETHYNYYSDVYYQGKGTLIKCSGNIRVNGTLKIFGICSGKTAKQLLENEINEHVKDIIYTKTKEHINAM
ncbi:hypothetical protein [Neptunitalea lumnitzerae]|uniref:hypothetical protein n=1 Tax=Neptunitalea lumnitzerae TaxID=2965509 RepID=UPI002490A5E0|nr:hypothetical protein [Neptunitalea sp. Y10]